jgi:translation initiation factor 2 subunit 2
MDFGALKKKKKKKKSMAEFEADMAEENDGEEVSEDKSKAKTGEAAWLKSDRDYDYEEVKRIIIIIMTNTSIKCISRCRSYLIVSLTF